MEERKSLPRIGDTAPNFSATTTHGPLMFHEWKVNKWAILFSHPADFTPVCSTELIEFAKRHRDFAQLDVQLIGLSIDSIHSHLAWVQNLRQIFDVELPFPMIADLSTQVAQAYGMIHPGESETVTVRAVFVVDPAHKIRALVYYPLNIGRNVDEIFRLVRALQTVDANSVACPVNWQPGEKVIVPPPKSMEDVKARLNSNYERLDFYLCRRDL